MTIVMRFIAFYVSLTKGYYPLNWYVTCGMQGCSPAHRGCLLVPARARRGLVPEG